MERSLKLKLSGPKEGTGAGNWVKELAGSALKQWPKWTEGGCMAANGEDCSIVAGQSVSQLSIPV